MARTNGLGWVLVTMVCCGGDAELGPNQSAEATPADSGAQDSFDSRGDSSALPDAGGGEATIDDGGGIDAVSHDAGSADTGVNDVVPEDTVVRCMGHTANCNGDPSDGCEADLETSWDHCGACGQPCPCGGCQAGVCVRGPVVIADNLGATSAYLPVGIAAVDETYLYVQPAEDGIAPLRTRVLRLPKTGGPTESFVDSDVVAGMIFSSRFVVDATHGYVGFERISPFDHGGMVGRFSKATRAFQPLTDDRLEHPYHIAIDTGSIYWWNAGTREIMKVPKAGGAVETIAETLDPVRGLVVDDERVYWLDGPDGAARLVSVNKSGGLQSVIATSLGRPQHLVQNTTSLFWPDADEAWLFVTSKASAISDPFLSYEWLNGQGGVLSLAASDDMLYWTLTEGADGLGGVYGIDLAGGTQHIFAADHRLPDCATLDDRCVYWTTRNPAQLWAAPR